jgi:hypothetical protein
MITPPPFLFRKTKIVGLSARLVLQRIEMRDRNFPPKEYASYHHDYGPPPSLVGVGGGPPILQPPIGLSFEENNVGGSVPPVLPCSNTEGRAPSRRQISSSLVLFSAFCFGAAVWRHLEPGVPPPRIDVSRIPPWLLVAVNGFLALVALVALAALLGIWFGRTPGVST